MLPGPTITSTASIDSRAIRHRADGLGAADRVHLVDLRDRGGRERRLGHPTRLPIRRDTQHDAFHTRDSRRDGRHQHGGRIHRAPARYVASGPVDGHGHRPYHDTITLIGRAGTPFTRVKVRDGARRDSERVADRGSDPREGGREIRRRHSYVAERHAVEPLGELANRVVTSCSDVGEDLANRRHRHVLISHGPRQARAKVA